VINEITRAVCFSGKIKSDGNRVDVSKIEKQIILYPISRRIYYKSR
jgi:hypothetical protein